MPATTIEHPTGPFTQRKPTKSLTQLGKELYESLDNVSEAVEALTDMLTEDRALLNQVSEQIINEAARSTIRNTMLATRGRVMNGGDLLQAAAGVGRTIMDWPLSDGTPLGDARKDALLAQAQVYTSRAKTEAHRARWLAAVAERLKTKTVRQTLSTTDVERLFEETKEI